MDVWQAIIGLIISLSALVGAVAVSVRISAANSKQALAILDRELNQEKEETKRLRGRVSELEEKRKERSLTIKNLEKNITTLLRQMEEMQEWKEGAEKQLQEREATIERQGAEIDRIKGQNNSLFEANKTLQTEVRTYEKAFTWMGIQREIMAHIETDDITDSAAKAAKKSNHQNAVTGEMGDQTINDTEEKN